MANDLGFFVLAQYGIPKARFDQAQALDLSGRNPTGSVPSTGTNNLKSAYAKVYPSYPNVAYPKPNTPISQPAIPNGGEQPGIQVFSTVFGPGDFHYEITNTPPPIAPISGLAPMAGITKQLSTDQNIATIIARAKKAALIIASTQAKHHYLVTGQKLNEKQFVVQQLMIGDTLTFRVGIYMPYSDWVEEIRNGPENPT